MSASTPNATEPPRPRPEQAIAERHVGRRPRERQSPWVLVSLLLHLAGIGIAMLFPPVRQAVLGDQTPPRPKTEIRVDGERLAQITEQVRDINREELLQDVMELRRIEQEMLRLQEMKQAEFEPFERQQAAEAAQRAQEQLDEALAAQQMALEQLEQARAQPETFNESLQEAQRQQAEAEAAQQEGLARAKIADVPLTRTVEVQREAIAAQEAANQTTREAKSSHDEQNSAQKKLDAAQKRHDKAQADLEDARKKLEQSLTTLDERQRQAEQAKAKAQEAAAAAEAAAQGEQQAQARLDEAKRKLEESEARSPQRKEADEAHKQAEKQLAEARKQASQAKSAAKKAQNDVRNAERQLQSARAQADKAQADHARRQDAAAAAESELAKAEAAVAEAQAGGTDIADAIAQQEQAIRRQAEAIELMKHELAEKSAEAAAQVAESGDGPKSSDALAQAAQPDDLLSKNLPQLYEQARTTEARIADLLKEIRAAELAMLTDSTLEQARANTDVPLTQRPAVDAELLTQTITKGSDYRKQAQQIETVRREAESMVNAAANMLASASALVRKQEQGSTVALERITADAAAASALARASHELEGGKSADLAALMQSGSAGVTSTSARTDSSLGDSEADQPTHQPPQMAHIKDAPPARKFVRSDAEAPYGGGWVFIDSWYTIGPWDNRGRANLHRSYPPESVIDFDAVYAGKDGRPIRWQHVQSDRPEIAPPNAEEYGIWYAYTEVWFDQPADLWIAVGSDDRSDLWINGMRVWSSIDDLKGWSIGEGLRRVHFQQGRNRILARIENGWRGMAWSLCLHLGQR